MVLLSIIIPVYNRQELLDRLLSDLSKNISDHVLSSSVEVIIVDDFSVTSVVISNYQYRYKLIRNMSNLGAPLSREIGFKLSVGNFIHFHDSDDSITNNWLVSLISILEEKSDIDVLLTGRYDVHQYKSHFRFQKYFHRYQKNIRKINNRLVYRNCIGPLGGVTFSRDVLEKIKFKQLASCQDWQMYIDILKYSKKLLSKPNIKFIFDKTGNDRISHNPRKKILGHLQLAKITGKKSVFGRNIRLFYLYTCKKHIYNKGGAILRLYKRKKFRIITTFLIVSIFWSLT